MKLKSINKIENRRSYDISVDETNCFFANNVLVHNSNASFVHNPIDGIWTQSRGRIITPMDDNAGFATFVMSKKQIFIDLIQLVRDTEGDNIGENDTVIIFGEWAGGSIQKGVAINGIEKSFFIFDVKVTPEDGSDSYYVNYNYLRDNDNRIYNIDDFLSYKIEIDFNRPDLAQEELIEITNQIEALCPVGKAFGNEGVGEGCVWSTTFKGSKLRFKVKGEKHTSKSKVKTLKKVDSERVGRIYELINKIVPIGRLQQQMDLACDTINGGIIDRKYLGDYIRMVIKDTMEEEMDLILESGFTPKDINKYISQLAKDFWFEQEKF